MNKISNIWFSPVFRNTVWNVKAQNFKSLKGKIKKIHSVIVIMRCTLKLQAFINSLEIISLIAQNVVENAEMSRYWIHFFMM